MPLLATKLDVPRVRPDLVERSHLVEWVNAGLDRKLTLICAPAGFGKSTLLGEWAANYGRPVAWLSLEESDNDSTRFLAYLVAALQRIEETVGHNLLNALQSTQPPSTEDLLTTLVNQIGAMSASVVLVLDDYHLITIQPIHQAIAFLLDHLPANMHLVIATRSDPPLPIARLRGRAQLTELRQADLRFTAAEATEFLHQATDLELSADDVAALVSRTEGWIAGLQMAAISMRGQENPAGFIQALTGSDRYILDYLAEEVFEAQPSDIQTFLLHTCILNRLSGSLCSAVLEGSNVGSSQQALEYLERHNLFVIPLDNERCWYRYHRLFVDLLQRRLHRAQPDLVPTLHRRASEWYEHNGPVATAIDHALWARDFERAAQLIELAAEGTLKRSEVATLLRWVESLPDQVVCSRPLLVIFHAWALLLSGFSIETLESRVRDIDTDGDGSSLRGKRAALHARIAALRGDISRASELSVQALEQLAEDDAFSRSMTIWTLGMAHWAVGDGVAGRQALQEAARVSQATGNVMVAVTTLSRQAGLRMLHGQLHKAETLYRQALALATDERGARLPVAGEALIGLGELCRERNRLEAAADYLVEGIELTGRSSELTALGGLLSLARVRQARGDADGALDTLQQARQIALKTDATDLDDLTVALAQARLWIDQGDLGAAQEWAGERKLIIDNVADEIGGLGPGTTERSDGGASPTEPAKTPDIISYNFRMYEYVALAHVLLAQGRPDEALTLLHQLLPVIEQRGRYKGMIEIHVLQALALEARGDTTSALTSLERAFSLAEPQGYVRVFVDEGAPMAKLLRRAKARGTAPKYVNELLAALDTSAYERTVTSPVHSETPALIEPLSERESEVLWFLATHLSSTEIAEELLISPNTVRFHIKNIYAKLGVHRRSDAVDRAKELGLF
jgi:LuxR family maltose regulon positive regulatory protein